MGMGSLKTVEIDIEQGIYRVNGKDISKSCTGFHLAFEEGVWSLQTIEEETYIGSNHTD